MLFLGAKSRNLQYRRQYIPNIYIILPATNFCLRLDAHLGLKQLARMTPCIRGVHGNGEDWDPMGPMGFPWEWE